MARIKELEERIETLERKSQSVAKSTNFALSIAQTHQHAADGKPMFGQESLQFASGLGR